MEEPIHAATGWPSDIDRHADDSFSNWNRFKKTFPAPLGGNVFLFTKTEISAKIKLIKFITILFF